MRQLKSTHKQLLQNLEEINQREQPTRNMTDSGLKFDCKSKIQDIAYKATTTAIEQLK